MSDKENLKLLKVVSLNMKNARKSLGISQMKLANLCELSQSYIGEVESTKKYPSLKTLSVIAKKLNINAYELLLDKETKETFDKDYLITNIKNELKVKLDETYNNYFNKN